MESDSFTHEWCNQTTLHPLGLIALLVSGSAFILLPHRTCFLPLLMLVCFVAPAQRVVLFGLDFNFLRLMILAGWVRVFLRSEARRFTWHSLDTAMVLWTIGGTIVFSIQYGSVGFVNRLGHIVYEQLGSYLLFRFLIRDWKDLQNIIKSFMLISIISAIFFLVENVTGRNVFSIFGGVDEFTIVRQGRLRCQGAFPHPIIAGCFWVSLLPMIGALWLRTHSPTIRWLALCSSGACLVIITTTASSTPLISAFAGLIAMLAYFLRRWMRLLRWLIVAMLVVVHATMNAPIWHLLSRIDAVGGSTGYHRYLLIDNFITRFDEWWLLGTTDPGSWGYGQQDITNHYIAQGVSGGLLTFVLFLAIIFLAYRHVGRLLRTVVRDPSTSVLAWSLGASLFIHCTSFLGVSYFGQIVMVWSLMLAAVASLSPAPAVRAMPALGRHTTAFAGAR